VTSDPRRYPSAPVVGVGAVVCLSETSVVLVRRAHEPLVGRWTLPGGAVELGETLRAALQREIREETGLVVDVGPLVDVVDHVEIDHTGRPVYHFVIVDYLCRAAGGQLAAGSDADRAVAADVAALDEYGLTPRARSVIARAFELYTGGGSGS
jgi:mutator protein MutT